MDLSLDEICARVQRSTGVDAHALYALYCDQEGSPTPDGFAYFLSQEKIIDNELLAELVATTGVDTILLEDPIAPSTKQQQQATAGPMRYEMLGCLGRGAMGEVFVAKDIDLRRRVAFKTLLPQMAARRDVVQRFISEVQITSQLDHPAIVPVYGLERTSDGRCAYAMKWVQGRELEAVLKEAKTTLEAGGELAADLQRAQRIEYVIRICDAVSFAHSKGIIHRDLKPANIMVGRFGEVYLMDWGIAKPMQGGIDAEALSLDLGEEQANNDLHSKTRVGRVIGTPIYMSPEQARGENDELDEKSDLYALGLVLQRVVSLQRSIPGEDMAQVLEAARAGKRVRFEAAEGEAAIDRELKAIVAKATHPDASERYVDVASLAADLRRYQRGEEVQAAPDSVLRRLARWGVKHRLAVLGTMVVVFAVGIAAVISAGSMLTERRVVEQAHARERRLSGFLTESAAAAADMDIVLQRLESLTERLIGAGTQALQNPADGSRPLHLPSWFAAAPDRTIQAAGYSPRIGVVEPVLWQAGKADDSADQQTQDRLASLRSVLRRSLLSPANADYEALPIAAQNALIAVGKSVVVSSFVTTTNGFHLAYPAVIGKQEVFDGRRLAAYRMVKDRVGLRWGAPHTSTYFATRLVACSGALRNGRGELLGVAGIQVSIERLLKQPFSKHIKPGVVLITGAGEVVLGSKSDFEKVRGEGLLARLRSERFGVFAVDAKEGASRGPQAVVYPVTSAGWYYVRLLASANTSATSK